MEAPRLGRIKKSRLRSAYATFSFLLGYRVKVEWKKVLPKLMAIVTRHPRYLPNIDWAKGNWTHNVFRVYETIFWRRQGIRAEISSYKDNDGNEYHMAHSVEGAFALTETYIREYLASWKFVPFKIYIPVLRSASGMPVFQSPYLFAIAFDAVSNGITSGAGTTNTISHTCTGTDLILWSGVGLNIGTNPGITSLTYAGTTMTVTSNSPTNAVPWLYLYYLAAPATGANNIVLTVAGATNDRWNFSTSYSGAAQSGIPDAVAKTENTSATTSTTLTLTTVADNCWLVGMFRNNIGGGVAGTNTTMRYNNGDGGIADTNAAQTPAGSKSIQMTFASTTNAGLGASFAPVITTFTVSVSDQLNITDVVTIVNIKNISVSDQLNVTESVTREANNFISVSDQLDITESITIFINPLLVSVSDQLNITESVTTVLFQKTLSLSISDQLNITENIQTGLDNYISVNDQITITESISTSVQSNISVSDQLNITEAVTPGLTSFISVSDQLDVTESVTKTVSEAARGLTYMRGNDQNLPVTLTKQDYPLGFNDTSVS